MKKFHYIPNDTIHNNTQTGLSEHTIPIQDPFLYIIHSLRGEEKRWKNSEKRCKYVRGLPLMKPAASGGR